MGYQQTYDSLSYGTFPTEVQSILEKTENNNPTDVFRSEFGGLFESKGKEVLKKIQNLQYEQGRRQLLGCLATLLWIRKSHQMTELNQSSIKNFRLNVGRISDKSQIYLEYPGKKAIEDWHYLGPFELDYAVNVENWVNTKGGQTPRHAEIFSDVYWKAKEAKLEQGNQQLAAVLKEAVNAVYRGEYPSEVLKQNKILSDFNIGNSPEVLFHSIYWIAIQEDFNYAKYQGREMSRTVLNRIIEIDTQEFTRTKTTYPDNVTIHDFPEYLNIITADDVKGFDPDDRGELLSVETITQAEFEIE